MSNYKKLLIIASSLLLPLAAGAQGGGATLGSMADAIATTIIYVGRVIAVIFWVVAGVLFLTAQGEPDKLNKAKLSLFAAIGGTILVIIAPTAIGFVGRSFGI